MATERPRRILYVDLAPAVGGSIISLHLLVKGLDRSRYAPHVVLRQGNGYIERFRALGVPVHVLDAALPAPPAADELPVAADPAPERWGWLRHSRPVQALKALPAGERLVHLAGFYLRQWPRVQREARALTEIMVAVQPDLVHLNDVVGVSRAGIVAARRLGLPAICHLRALDRRNHFDRWISRSLCGYIVISQAVDRHQRTLGGRTDPSWIVYNAIDRVEYEQAVDRQAVRAEFGVRDDQVLVGSVGRLVPWKGQDVLVRALARLAREHPEVRVLFVGAPEAHARDYAQALQEQVRDLRLNDVIQFVGYRRDVPSLLRVMDIVVHTSVAPEPFGRVLIEGMAAGAAVIGSDAGAVPEIIEDRVSGLLVPPGDDAALADALRYALTHPEERATWCRTARQVVAARFTADQYVRGIESVYKELFL